MNIISKNNLSSQQDYMTRGAYGYSRPDNYIEPEEQTFICPLCREIEVEYQGDYCKGCLKEENEN